jgi:hypothetical protein
LGFINESEGYVLIVVDDVPSLLPPQGFADLSTTKNVSIKIIDSGMGMKKDFLVNDYFRPMTKGVSRCSRKVVLRILIRCICRMTCGQAVDYPYTLLGGFSRH